MGDEALDILGHTGRMVGSGAANALDHVHPIARLLADGTVVLWAPEVSALLGHLSQLQALSTPARRLSLSAEWVRLRVRQTWAVVLLVVCVGEMSSLRKRRVDC